MLKRKIETYLANWKRSEDRKFLKIRTCIMSRMQSSWGNIM